MPRVLEKIQLQRPADTSPKNSHRHSQLRLRTMRQRLYGIRRPPKALPGQTFRAREAAQMPRMSQIVRPKNDFGSAHTDAHRRTSVWMRRLLQVFPFEIVLEQTQKVAAFDGIGDEDVCL